MCCKKISIIAALLVVCSLLGCNHASWADSGTGDLLKIKENFKKVYIIGSPLADGLQKGLEANPPGFGVSDRVVMELQQRVPFSKAFIEELLAKQNEEGAWTDINYADKTRSGWEPRLHPERILGLVKACQDENSEYYQSEKVIRAVHAALGFWFKEKLKCPNWYYNQIGVPRTLGVAFILFEEHLTADERKQAVELMKDSRFGMTGQNKVWLAGNVMMRALLENDQALVQQARDTIVSEIRTGQKEGIKDDWSFHQHGPQQQFGNYGLAYISSMSLFSGLFAGTSMAFSDEQLGIIGSLLDKGYQWVIWKGNMDVSALGRQLFRSAPEHKAWGAAFAAVELGGGKNRFCNEVAERMTRNCFSPKKNTLVGHKHFWQSDYTLMRQPSWMASLKMASTRVLGTESMNGDNKKGYYLADGALFVYGSGREYLNIFPVWDWRKVPGVTTYASDAAVPVLKKSYYPGNGSDFVGGISDGKQGLSVMELKRDGLTVRKYCLFTPEALVVLGSGIQSDSLLPVTTSIEQCWAADEAEVWTDGTWKKLPTRQTFAGQGLRLLHGQKGYIIPEGQCVAEVEERSGRWNDIMQIYREQTEEGKVFSLYMNHGTRPSGASYQYYILPQADRKAVERFSTDDFKVMVNTEKMQVVHVAKEDAWWIAAWEKGTFTLEASLRVDVLTPGLYCIKRQGDSSQILCGDPTQQRDSLVLEINGVKKTIQLPQGKDRGTAVACKL